MIVLMSYLLLHVEFTEEEEEEDGAQRRRVRGRRRRCLDFKSTKRATSNTKNYSKTRKTVFARACCRTSAKKIFRAGVVHSSAAQAHVCQRLHSKRRFLNRLKRDGLVDVDADSVPDNVALERQRDAPVSERDKDTVRRYFKDELSDEQLDSIKNNLAASNVKWIQNAAAEPINAAVAGVPLVRREGFLKVGTRQLIGERLRLHELDKLAPAGAVDKLRNLHAEWASLRDDVFRLLDVVLEQATLWMAEAPLERVIATEVGLRGLTEDLATFVCRTRLCTDINCSCDANAKVSIDGKLFFSVETLVSHWRNRQLKTSTFLSELGSEITTITTLTTR